jgi:hypothetical protein
MWIIFSEDILSLVLKVRLKVLEDYKKVVAISMYSYDDNDNDDDK